MPPAVHGTGSPRASLVFPPQRGRLRPRLTNAVRRCILMCMKRTNLVLDERLLEEALRASGERTYSKAVGRALDEFVRKARAGRILELAGSGLWQGDLSKMREDRAVREPGTRRTRRGPR